jgi:hypothetical protein
MKKKLEEFLELEKKATPGPWRVGNLVSWHGDTGKPFRNVWSGEDDEAWKVAEFQSGLCDVNAQFIAQSRTIAPQAVQKSLEAAELLERAKEEIQNIYGRDNDLTMEIFRFLEDFNND